DPQPGLVRLHYFSAGGRFGALRLDARGAAVIPDLAPVDELLHHVRLFHYQMDLLSGTGRPVRDHRAQALERAHSHLAGLAGRVLRPVLAGCDVRELRIVPTGALFRLPWHALPWQGRPLVHSSAVSLGDPDSAAPPLAAARSGALVLGCGDPGTAEI